ncbi:MAG: hypothetical protein LUQ17_01160 [Methanomicrobiales archaeon]|nr:hypothetical protein [Methanomicrobiales archaeon]
MGIAISRDTSCSFPVPGKNSDNEPPAGNRGTHLTGLFSAYLLSLESKKLQESLIYIQKTLVRVKSAYKVGRKAEKSRQWCPMREEEHLGGADNPALDCSARLEYFQVLRDRVTVHPEPSGDLRDGLAFRIMPQQDLYPDVDVTAGHRLPSDFYDHRFT